MGSEEVDRFLELCERDCSLRCEHRIEMKHIVTNYVHGGLRDGGGGAMGRSD